MIGRIIFGILTIIALYFCYQWFGLTVFLWTIGTIIVTMILTLLLTPLGYKLGTSFAENGPSLGPILGCLFYLGIGIAFSIYIFRTFGWQAWIMLGICTSLANAIVTPSPPKEE